MQLESWLVREHTCLELVWSWFHASYSSRLLVYLIVSIESNVGKSFGNVSLIFHSESTWLMLLECSYVTFTKLKRFGISIVQSCVFSTITNNSRSKHIEQRLGRPFNHAHPHLPPKSTFSSARKEPTKTVE